MVNYIIAAVAPSSGDGRGRLRMWRQQIHRPPLEPQRPRQRPDPCRPGCHLDDRSVVPQESIPVRRERQRRGRLAGAAGREQQDRILGARAREAGRMNQMATIAGEDMAQQPEGCRRRQIPLAARPEHDGDRSGVFAHPCQKMGRDMEVLLRLALGQDRRGALRQGPRPAEIARRCRRELLGERDLDRPARGPGTGRRIRPQDGIEEVGRRTCLSRDGDAEAVDVVAAQGVSHRPAPAARHPRQRARPCRAPADRAGRFRSASPSYGRAADRVPAARWRSE